MLYSLHSWTPPDHLFNVMPGHVGQISNYDLRYIQNYVGHR